MPSPFSIIVHGGAWAIPHEATEENLAGVRTAATAGRAVLAAGGSALDAAETAVKLLENDPTFAAGNGACLTDAGTVELDASVMYAPPSGAKPIAGAVCAVRIAPKNAVTLARAVAEKSEHVLLAAHGADEFTHQQEIPCVHPDELVSDAARAEWEQYKKYGSVVGELFNSGHDTVGAACIDSHGGFAAATSTGGITYKRVGRVGDSPVIGAGVYADDDAGAISTTGHGESILMCSLAKHAAFCVEHKGMDAMSAAKESVAYMKRKTGGCGGLVMVDKNARIGWAFSTNRMAWAAFDVDGVLTSGIDGEAGE